jgi:hypothetical protein
MQDFEEKLYFESLIDSCSNPCSDLLGRGRPGQEQGKGCRERKPVEEFCFQDNTKSQIEISSISPEESNYLKSMRNMSTIFVSDKLHTSPSIHEQILTKTPTCPVSNSKDYIVEKFQQKTLQVAFDYNQQSIQAITHILGDLITFITINLLALWMKPQIIILKSFLAESIYSLSDTTKSFLLILLTDLLVGFHSPKGWEVVIEVLLRHFGFPENQNFIFLFVGTFPVFLDTVFKYWIFRQLNKISPSTVATYHNMIE